MQICEFPWAKDIDFTFGRLKAFRKPISNVFENRLAINSQKNIFTIWRKSAQLTINAFSYSDSTAYETGFSKLDSQSSSET